MATNIVWILCVVATSVLVVDGAMKRPRRSTGVEECIYRCRDKFASCFKANIECPFLENTNPEDAAKACLDQLQECIKDCRAQSH
ncbi:hypothetical protein LSAT2_016721 [Lamellibrachia satsuma]|nr:hypothetical protein LSAT2_016721 [Lamellibrachia satsuma]